MGHHIQRLTVLYDADCGFCCRCASWMQAQPAHVWIYVIPQGSDEVKERFPALRQLPKAELTVIDDQGGVYYGDSAWILCLWALREWRPWSYRMASPGLRPLARESFELVSHNRHLMNSMLGLKNERVIANRMRQALPEEYHRCDGECAHAH